MTQRRYAVTGSSGFLGTALVRELRRRGTYVYGLSRHRGEEDRFVPFDFAGGIAPKIPYDVEALVHAAWSFDPDVAAANINGTLSVFDACDRLGLRRVVFVSSMSAHALARSSYGRSKYELELRARQYGFVSVRPGFLLGSLDRRTGRAIERLTRFPIVPVFFPDRKALHFARVEDAAQQIADLLESPPAVAEPQVVAAKRAHSLGELVRYFARSRGRKARPLPIIPGAAAVSALRVAESLFGALPLTSDSAAGLVHAAANPGAGASWHAVPDPLAPDNDDRA